MQDDPDNATDTYGRFFSFRHPGTPTDDQSLTAKTISPNLTMDDASPYVLTHTPSHFQRMIGTNYSYGFETDEAQLQRNGDDHTKVSSVPYRRGKWSDGAGVCSKLNPLSGPTRSKCSCP